MRSITTLTCVLAASVGLAACGGDDGEQQETTAAPPPTATAEITPTTPTATGGRVDLAEFRSCVEGSGLKAEPEPDEADGLQGKGLKVPLGEGDFDDPSEPGTFAFYAHVYVFDTPANAKKFDGLATGSRFQDGEVHQNAYVGYNTDAPKVPSTPAGSALTNCLR
jgi:hypothetical protein